MFSALSSARNFLVLNCNKSKFMALGSEAQIEKTLSEISWVYILRSEIEMVKKVRNLDILMDNRLCFEDHVLFTASNSLLRLKVLYKINRFLNEEVRLCLFSSL